MHLPKDEAGRPGRAPENFQPGVSEATVSVAEHWPHQPLFPKPANVTHAMCERARRTQPKKQRAENVSEEQHQPKPMSHCRESQNYKVLFCRLTPELSRADRGGWGPVLPACPQVSTKRRHGVGLNDLLGGKEAGEGEAMAHMPKDRSPDT